MDTGILNERALVDLSIVIPVWNESKKITADIQAAMEYLENRHLKGEVIIVDDGSRDDTAAVAQRYRVPAGQSLKVLRSPAHKGKGYAVRRGIQESIGQYVLFIDSGRCVPYGSVDQGLQLLIGGESDIAHGSRKLPRSRIIRRQTFTRRIFARLFRWLMLIWMNLPKELTDTQCGLKLYRGEVARELYNSCITDGFMFDIEIILRAEGKGYRIREFPIEWGADRDSRLSVRNTIWPMMRELCTIKRSVT